MVYDSRLKSKPKSLGCFVMVVLRRQNTFEQALRFTNNLSSFLSAALLCEVVDQPVEMKMTQFVLTNAKEYLQRID